MSTVIIRLDRDDISNHCLFFFSQVLEMVLTRSSPAASKAADIAVPSSSIRMKSHPSPGAPSPGAPAPSASRIQTRSSPNIAAAGPSVGAPGPSSSAGHTISSKSNRKKHKMPISMKMNDGSVVDKVLEFEVFFRFRSFFLFTI